VTSDHTRQAGVAAAALLLLLAAPARPQGPATRESLDFGQRKAQAHMQELEDRMFQLAGLIREAQPDHAARLVLGLRRSRGDLIVADMADIRALITAGKIEEAVERQRIVVSKLEELRRLLLSADLDLVLKLERLRHLNRVGKALAEAKGEQDRQADALDKLAKEDAASEEAKRKLAAAAEAAGEMTRKLDDLAAEAKEAQGAESEVAKDLDAARREMAKAGQDLDAAKPDSASGKCRASCGKVGAASDKVGKAREQLLEELQDPIRAAVIDSLGQMVQLQEKVSAAIADPAKELTRPQLDGLRDLERGVIDLARNTRDLVEETEFSVALPAGLRFGESLAVPSAAAFAAGKVDPEVRRKGGRLLGDLKEMLRILVEESAGAKEAGRPSAGGCKGCADRNKLVSELSVVRMLEAGILVDTRAAEGRRGAAAEGAAREITNATRSLVEWQDQARDLSEKLKGRSCSRCLHEQE
jgi:hypothetical protein